MNKTSIKFILLILIFFVSLSLCLFFNLDFSAKNILLYYIRIPAVIKAISSGSCLALSGMFLQTVSKNPLADPYLTGLSSGAGLGIALSILFFNTENYSLFGLVGALLSATAVILLSGFSKFSITKLILIGLSFNLFAGSLISFLILMNPTKAYPLTLILTGGFSNANISNTLLIALLVFVIALSSIFIPKLNLLRLDDKLVFKTKGQSMLYNIIFVILASLLTSVSVYSAGILGFAGIICPIFCKMLFGSDCRILFFANILTGASLLLFSNFLSVNLVYPLQIPLGVIVSIVGCPFFIFFLLKKGGILNN